MVILWSLEMDIYNGDERVLGVSNVFEGKREETWREALKRFENFNSFERLVGEDEGYYRNFLCEGRESSKVGGNISHFVVK